VFPGSPYSDADDQQFFASPRDFGDVALGTDAQRNADLMYQRYREYAVGPDYIEAQVHGGVMLSDIERIVFDRTPSEDIASKLDGLGIPWEVEQ
jgi:hypothetical protein